MFAIDKEKNTLTKNLSEQYSRNIINLEEYERILEYINKIETKKEISIIEKIMRENEADTNEAAAAQYDAMPLSETGEKHLSMFSWRTSNIKPLNGNGGKYISIFGTNRIIVDNLPKGRTLLDVHSIFGLTEIVVSKNIKITNRTVPVFSGIFAPYPSHTKDEELPELYITGKAIFGNITIKII